MLSGFLLGDTLKHIINIVRFFLSAPYSLTGLHLAGFVSRYSIDPAIRL